MVHQNNNNVLQKWIIVRVSDKFVALSHCDIRTNIGTLKSVQVIYAITQLDFIILPFSQFLLVKSWDKYI